MPRRGGGGGGGDGGGGDEVESGPASVEGFLLLLVLASAFSSRPWSRFSTAAFKTSAMGVADFGVGTLIWVD